MGKAARGRKVARFGEKGSTLCGQTKVLVWLNAVRAIRAWKQTVAVLVAPPVVTIVLVLLQLLANVVVDKEGANAMFACRLHAFSRTEVPPDGGSSRPALCHRGGRGSTAPAH